MTVGELEDRAAKGDPKAVQALNAFAAELMPMTVDALGTYRHAELQIARLTEEPLVVAEAQRTRHRERRERLVLWLTAVPAAAVAATLVAKLIG